MKCLLLCALACLPMLAIINVSFGIADWQYWASIPAAWWMAAFVILADEAA